MAEDKKPPPPSTLGSGAAARAAAALRSRRDRLDEAEKRDTGYKAGGSVKAPSPAAIRSYSREYDTQSPAGRNVHEGFAAGGMVGCKQTRGFGKARRGS
jgi:hypothetical protein